MLVRRHVEGKAHLHDGAIGKAQRSGGMGVDLDVHDLAFLGLGQHRALVAQARGHGRNAGDRA
ncbi:hypothetical protein D3C72_1976260 [compost metagenome]